MGMTNPPALAVRVGPLARVHRSVVLDQDSLRRVRVMAVVGLIALNIADLVLTRHLLDRGGVEANPLMALFIAGGWGNMGSIGRQQQLRPVSLIPVHSPVGRSVTCSVQ